MTITVGMIGSQQGPAINPLLIFMSAIRVNSGTAEMGKNVASRPTPCMQAPHETSLLALHHQVNGRAAAPFELSECWIPGTNQAG
jgi:hypothetical protein